MPGLVGTPSTLLGEQARSVGVRVVARRFAGSDAGMHVGMDSQAIEVAVLDVNETLFRIDGLVPFFEAAGLSAADVPLWFARTLRDGFALAAMGSYRSFADVGGAVLRGLGADDPGEILAGFTHLQPHSDVAQGLASLRHAGIRVVTLTVGSAEITRALLSRWDLAGYVESTYDVSPVRRWKPAPEPYRWVAAQCHAPIARCILVAAHPWDTAGAKRAGMRAAWLSRLEPSYPTTFEQPDLTAATLLDVAQHLAADR